MNILSLDFLGLAALTVISRSLSENDHRDRSLAPQARLVVTAIYFELQLEIAWLTVAAKEVTQGSAACVDCFTKHGFDCVNQGFHAAQRDAAGLPFRMNARYIK